MSWNVRGLNQPAKRAAISEIVATHKAAILCLQETKIETWMPAIVRDIGGAALTDCVVLPAIGSRGGAAIFWNSDLASIASHAVGEFSITAKVTLLR